MKTAKGPMGEPWPHIAIDRGRLRGAVDRCRAAGVKYRLYPLAKAPHLNAIPGLEFKFIDCSGWFRWALWQAATEAVPDGSWHQHEWLKAQGFKRSTYEAGALVDNVVRAAYLSPLAGSVGHIAFVLDGLVYESAGGTGPRRTVSWGAQGWHRRASLYVLSFAPAPVKATSAPGKAPGAPAGAGK